VRNFYGPDALSGANKQKHMGFTFSASSVTRKWLFFASAVQRQRRIALQTRHFTGIRSGVVVNQELWECYRHGERGSANSSPHWPPGQGVKGRSPLPWTWKALAFGHPTEAANLPYSLKALRVKMFKGML